MSALSIGIIGTGAVARMFGRALASAGARVDAVAGSDPGRRAAAAAFIGGQPRLLSIDDIHTLPDHVLIAVADDRLAEAGDRLARSGWPGSVVLHSSGSRGIEALAPLRGAGRACGVCHPLQSVVVSERVDLFRGVTFALAGDEPAVALGASLATLVGGIPIGMPERALPVYHAAAVMASNGMSAVLDASEALMIQAGLTASSARAAIAPLARVTLENALSGGAAATATGPVVRGDVTTVSRHLDALATDPLMTSLYASLSRRLLEIAERRGLDRERATTLAQMLSPSETQA